MAKPPLWNKAAALAARAHEHQLRKDGVTPYIAHPARVALTVACVFGFTDEAIIAAALLHDTIEDCDVDFDDVHEGYGLEVAQIVAALTKDMRMIEPQREPAYDAQLAAGPWQARLIKLADQYDNLLDAVTDDRKRATLTRAQRALTLAEDDAQLENACGILRQLADEIESTIGGS